MTSAQTSRRTIFTCPRRKIPALGYRAIRICLQQPDIFKTQLRALYRASAFWKDRHHVPHDHLPAGIHRYQNYLCEEVKSELRKDAIPFREDVEIGIMIETPAAALISGDLAKESGLFQRGNQRFDPVHPGHRPAKPQAGPILRSPPSRQCCRLIRMAVENAHANGIWIGICGELGADLALTETFLSYGIDELSVSPSMILPLRKKVRETTLK